MKKSIICRIASALFAAAVTAATVFFTVSCSSGKMQVETETAETKEAEYALKSENYGFTASELEYLFYQNYYSEMAVYGSTSSDMYNIDPSKKLSEQAFPDAGGKTWYDHFLEGTLKLGKSILVNLEAAKEAGFDLDGVSLAEADSFISMLKEQADSNEMALDELITERYGSSVTESDIKSAMALEIKADAYYRSLSDSCEFSDEECEAYYSENSEMFDAADLWYYTAVSDAEEDATEDEKNASLDRAKKRAEDIALCTDPEAFKKKLAEYYNEDLADEDGFCEELVEKAVESSRAERFRMSGDEVSEFALSKDRKIGDTAVIKTADDAYTAYLIESAPCRNEEPLRSVRDIGIYFSNHETAEEAASTASSIFNEYVEMGEGESAFAALAAKYSEDSYSSADGGLYENLERGDVITELDEWIYSSGRKAGDTAIINTYDSVHLIYYKGDGIPAWKQLVTDALTAEKVASLEDGYVEKYAISEQSALFPEA